MKPKFTPGPFYTATTIKDGLRHRGLVMRRNGSHAWEGAPRYHKWHALADAQKQAAIYNK